MRKDQQGKNFRKSKKSQQIQIEKEIEALRQQYADFTSAENVKSFKDLPLSRKTLKGLLDSKFTQPTEIQRESIGPALLGKDVLGAAQTGSGKTLAFLIPLLERLFMERWTRTDGVGAIIISPTRELAYQIFETLKIVGRHHDFSAGLIIGGKNLKFERKRMDQCNILICSPGRLLQHMDENPLFNASTMHMLVLDEADRCLDMGFEQTLNAIIENLPPERQTLLFSATQTNSVSDLARLNLREPVEIGQPQQKGALAIPELLQQNYVVVPLEEKITVLWSFIRNHQKHKIIVFLSSCKQVKFIYEMFCKLRPGVSLHALYSTLHQDKRIAIYNDFVQKSNVVLFATDIASRGLDFPSVNWVVQLDCPEDVNQYVHRAGRSARNKTRGESLLVLMPSEEEVFVEELNKKFIKVPKITIDAKKLFSPRIKMEAYLAQLPDLKATAQRAFVSYIKSIFLMRNKRLFNVFKLDFEAYAKSLGLMMAPRVRFLERFMKKNQAEQHEKLDEGKDALRGNVKAAKNVFQADSSDSDDGDDLFTVKRLDHDVSGKLEDDSNDIVVNETDEMLTDARSKKTKLISKAALAKKALKKKIQVNEHSKFDDEGNEVLNARKNLLSKAARKYAEEAASTSGGIDIAIAKKMLNEEDKFDKQRFRDLVKKRHKERKEKIKRKTMDKDQNSDDDDSDVDEFNGDEASDASSVDLSWLPDPSNVYNKHEDASDDGDDNDDEDFVQTNKKSKRNAVAAIAPHSDDEDAPKSKKLKVTSKLTLNDAEIIAEQLLANSY